MIRIALKMLLGDSAKFCMLVAGLVFATFLMAQQLSVFCGLMLWTTSTLKNVPAPLWVVEARVEQINETIPILDTDVARVRSVDSVAWAAPFFSSLVRVRLPDGHFKIVLLVGIESTSFAGAPARLLEGRIEDLRLPNAVIIDQLAQQRLSQVKGRKVQLGDLFEMNDREARVVGIAQTVESFTGAPFIWTTYERSMQYAPVQRKMLSAVMAAPRPGVSDAQCAADISKETGLRAFLNHGFGTGPDDLNEATMWWYVKNTGIPFSFGVTVAIGLIVGIAISCQTFYSFVLDHLRYLGALKAMGTSNFKLCLMLLCQSFTVGMIGYGIGMFFTARFGLNALKFGKPPFHMPEIIPPAVLGVILLICLMASLLGIWRVAKLEPAAVFRG
jgi:putative ABC transport system permease protein